MHLRSVRFITLFLLLTALLPAASYTAFINDQELTISGYDLSEVSGNVVQFFSLSNTRHISVRIGETFLSTDILNYDRTDQTLSSQGHFIMTLRKYSLAGLDLVFDPQTMSITADELKFHSKDSIFFNMQHFTVNKKQMVMENLNFSKGNAVVIDDKRLDILGLNEWEVDLYIAEARFYTDWYVIKDPVLMINNRPLLYTPTIVYDYSPAAFKIAPAFPRWGINEYRGNYWRMNIQYIVNENLFGVVQGGHSELKGTGYGFEHVYRLGSHDQFRYLNENWQYGYTEEKLSYRHSFTGPIHQPEDDYFKRRTRYLEKDWSRMVFEFTYNNYEEDNLEIFHRRPRYQLESDLLLPVSQLSLYTVSSYEYIEEVSSDNQGIKTRTLNELKHPIKVPFSKAAAVAFGWDNVYYDQEPFYWHQFYEYIDIDFEYKNILLKLKLKDFLYEAGDTPFAFDIPIVREDYLEPDLSYNLGNLAIGTRYRKGILTGIMEKEIYYLRIRQSNWSAKIEYNNTEGSWWAGFALELF